MDWDDLARVNRNDPDMKTIRLTAEPRHLPDTVAALTTALSNNTVVEEVMLVVEVVDAECGECVQSPALGEAIRNHPALVDFSVAVPGSTYPWKPWWDPCKQTASLNRVGRVLCPPIPEIIDLEQQDWCFEEGATYPRGDAALPVFELETSEEGGRVELGAGSMCKVFAGRLKNTPVAAKILCMVDDPALHGIEVGEGRPIAPGLLRELQDCVQEVIVLDSLRHENIVRLHGVVFSTFDTQVYPKWILMERVPKTLEECIARQEAEFVRHLRGIVNGLKCLHDNGIIHRDLKPGNILVTEDGVVKIADFGFARCHSRALLHNPEGTPTYRAPEVVTQRYDLPVDVYSVGVIGLQIQGVDPAAEHDIRLEQVRTLGGRSDYAQIISRCTETAPHLRPKCEGILEALENCASRHSIESACDMLEEDNGNHTHAVGLLTTASDRGFVDAQLELALCTLDAIGTKANPEDGADLLCRAAEGGSLKAQGYLALLSCTERFGPAFPMAHITPNHCTAPLVLWEADQTAASICARALCLELGIGTARDEHRAVEAYEASAALNHKWAHFRLGYCYLSGVGGRQDEAEGLRLLKYSAYQGTSPNPYAMYRLAQIFYDGELGYPNRNEAMELYRKSADRGCADGVDWIKENMIEPHPDEPCVVDPNAQPFDEREPSPPLVTSEAEFCEAQTTTSETALEGEVVFSLSVCEAGAMADFGMPSPDDNRELTSKRVAKVACAGTISDPNPSTSLVAISEQQSEKTALPPENIQTPASPLAIPKDVGRKSETPPLPPEDKSIMDEGIASRTETPLPAQVEGDGQHSPNADACREVAVRSPTQVVRVQLVVHTNDLALTSSEDFIIDDNEIRRLDSASGNEIMLPDRPGSSFTPPRLLSDDDFNAAGRLRFAQYVTVTKDAENFEEPGAHHPLPERGYRHNVLKEYKTIREIYHDDENEAFSETEIQSSQEQYCEFEYRSIPGYFLHETVETKSKDGQSCERDSTTRFSLGMQQVAAFVGSQAGACVVQTPSLLYSFFYPSTNTDVPEITTLPLSTRTLLALIRAAELFAAGTATEFSQASRDTHSNIISVGGTVLAEAFRWCVYSDIDLEASGSNEGEVAKKMDDRFWRRVCRSITTVTIKCLCDAKGLEPQSKIFVFFGIFGIVVIRECQGTNEVDKRSFWRILLDSALLSLQAGSHLIIQPSWVVFDVPVNTLIPPFTTIVAECLPSWTRYMNDNNVDVISLEQVAREHIDAAITYTVHQIVTVTYPAQSKLGRVQNWAASIVPVSRMAAALEAVDWTPIVTFCHWWSASNWIGLPQFISPIMADAFIRVSLCVWNPKDRTYISELRRLCAKYNLDDSATDEDIKKRRLQKARELHPDKNEDTTEAFTQMIRDFEKIQALRRRLNLTQTSRAEWREDGATIMATAFATLGEVLPGTRWQRRVQRGPALQNADQPTLNQGKTRLVLALSSILILSLGACAIPFVRNRTGALTSLSGLSVVQLT